MPAGSARPRSVEGMLAAVGRLTTPEGRERALAFRSKPDDVFISPYSKSGTTWLQQIAHGLRTRGDMDFDDISRVVPWLEVSPDLEIDLDADPVAPPRIFKSHLPWETIPKPGRYIVSLRDPKDVAVSLYRFLENWMFEAGSLSIEEVVHAVFTSHRNYWGHLRSWWGVRDRRDVLLLSFEGMKRDPETAVERIAAFLEIPLDPELREIVLRQSSVAFMKEHEEKFSDLLMRERSERVAGLPSGSDSSKVRKGEVGSHREELPAELGAELDGIWAEEITPILGFASYEELTRGL